MTSSPSKKYTPLSNFAFAPSSMKLQQYFHLFTIELEASGPKKGASLIFFLIPFPSLSLLTFPKEMAYRKKKGGLMIFNTMDDGVGLMRTNVLHSTKSDPLQHGIWTEYFSKRII